MSVAIPIPLLQNLPDVNVTPAVGVDEYALCWDNDTARFVLRAPFDGAPYALLAGRAGGQTLYGGTAANDDITIHGTSDGTRTTSYVLLQPSGGNVGIGTDAPGAKLEVLNGVNSYTNFLKLGFNNGTWNSTTIFDAFRFIDASVASPSDGSSKSFQVGAGGVAIGYANTPAYGSSDALYINGNVGIGTTAPATRLDIDAGALTMKEMTAAPTGVANKAMLYTKDTGGGKTALCCKLGDDVEIVLATQA